VPSLTRERGALGRGRRIVGEEEGSQGGGILGLRKELLRHPKGQMPGRKEEKRERKNKWRQSRLLKKMRTWLARDITACQIKWE